MHRVFEEIAPLIKEGITTDKIDKKAEEFIIGAGAKPAFKQVAGYQWATCICINEQVVHTPPSDRVIKSGDIVTVDAGVYYGGFNTDRADTFLVGADNPDIEKFLKAGQYALNLAIKAARAGKYIADISRVIYENIEKERGYYIVRELTGHGVGRLLHEDPAIPGFVDGSSSVKIAPGMTLAIEIIYCQSKSRLKLEKDRWSLKAKTGVMTACFEETIAINNHDTVILT